jgi:hypothetical protein
MAKADWCPATSTRFCSVAKPAARRPTDGSGYLQRSRSRSSDYLTLLLWNERERVAGADHRRRREWRFRSKQQSRLRGSHMWTLLDLAPLRKRPARASSSTRPEREAGCLTQRASSFNTQPSSDHGAATLPPRPRSTSLGSDCWVREHPGSLTSAARSRPRGARSHAPPWAAAPARASSAVAGTGSDESAGLRPTGGSPPKRARQLPHKTTASRPAARTTANRRHR